jgi:hypothetical protein
MASFKSLDLFAQIADGTAALKQKSYSDFVKGLLENERNQSVSSSQVAHTITSVGSSPDTTADLQKNNEPSQFIASQLSKTQAVIESQESQLNKFTGVNLTAQKTFEVKDGEVVGEITPIKAIDPKDLPKLDATAVANVDKSQSGQLTASTGISGDKALDKLLQKNSAEAPVV